MKKLLSILATSGVVCSLALSQGAWAAESQTLKADIKAEGNTLTINFTEKALVGGVELVDDADIQAKETFLNQFFNYEYPKTTELTNDQEIGYIKSLDLSKIKISTTEKSVKITLDENLIGDTSGFATKGLVRTTAYIDINSITDASGNTLSSSATGDLENLKAKSGRRIRIQARATYNPDTFELDTAKNEMTFVPAKSKAEFKTKQAEIAKDIAEEAKLAKEAKEAFESKDEAKIAEVNAKIAKLSRASSISALTKQIKKEQPKTEERAEENPVAENTQAQPVKNKTGNLTAITAPDTGFESKTQLGYIIAGFSALIASSYIFIKK